MKPVPTKCENLEDLACSAGWMLDRLYQNQGSGRALAGFRHLKSLRLFEADALSVTQMTSAPITLLHLVEPNMSGMTTLISTAAPSLPSLTVLCLESLRPSSALSFFPRHIASLLRFLPVITTVTIKLDVSYCSAAEVERIASGFQSLAANNAELSVNVNGRRADFLLSIDSPSTIRRGGIE